MSERNWLERCKDARRQPGFKDDATAIGVVVLGVLMAVCATGYRGYERYDERQAAGFDRATTAEKLGALTNCAYRLVRDATGNVRLSMSLGNDQTGLKSLNTGHDTAITDREVSLAVPLPRSVSFASPRNLNSFSVPGTAVVFGSSVEVNMDLPDDLPPPASVQAHTGSAMVYAQGYRGPAREVQPIIDCRPII